MKFFIIVLSVFGLHAQENIQNISSPDGAIRVNFSLDEEGRPFYLVFHKDQTVIDTSFLGFDLKDAPSLSTDFVVINSGTSSFNETWKMPWGEQLEVENNYNELKIDLAEKSGLKRKLSVTFRVFNDGIGFKYDFPEQENLKEVIITDENTEFALTGDHTSFWTPGDWDI